MTTGVSPDRRAALARLLREDADTTDAIPRRSPGASAPLSAAQQRLWFLQCYEPDSAAYNSVRAFRLTGDLDARALEAAFRRLIARHDVLRTVIAEEDGTPVQRALPQVDFALASLDGEAPLRDRLLAFGRRPFDLTRAPPLRVGLAHEPDGSHALLVVVHHIAADAWSHGRLLGDLAQAYRAALADGEGCPLPAPSLAYADFAAWQRARFDGAEGRATLERWSRYLGESVPVLALPVDHPRTARADRPGGRVDFTLPDALCRTITDLCQNRGLTPFVVLLAAWQILLGRLSGQTDFAVGVPNAARNRPELHDLVGFFVNTQVYRVRLDPQVRFLDLCDRLRGEALAFLADADVPFERLIAEADIVRDLQHTPVFQAAFNLRPARDGAALALDGLTAARLDFDIGSAKFDLTLDLAVSAAGIDGQIEYDAGLIDAATAARWRDHFVTLLVGLVAAPERPIQAVSLLAPQDVAELSRFNATAQSFPPAATVLERIAAQARAAPGAIAVVDDRERLTRSDLDARAARLARRLARAGAGPDTLVGLALERSCDLLVATLAILKAGAAFLPLVPDLPRPRLDEMVRDSGLRLLVTTTALAAAWPG
ncbi:condensation domain-containing protein, partial [Methylobacterium sp. J-068]|uniref:condensation domain-containing protein n=1 Tax=Methylobacterium sp. J-068 TaxID=2836649 RepID=UPI001FB9BE39